MEVLLLVFIVQGLLGAFDTIYHHELTERLPWRPTAAYELKLHGVRNFFYSLIFLSLGWLAWHGIWAYVFAFMLFLEVIITLIDFVEEDQTRKLPATERVTHTLLALNYGAILALLVPILITWSQQPTGFSVMNFGWLSWVMSFYALGVFIWGWRDLLRGIALSSKNNHPKVKIEALKCENQRLLITGGSGFIGQPLCQALIEQGHYVTILTRNSEKTGSLFNGRMTLINSLSQLNESDEFDAIINLAGEPISQRWTLKSKAKILESRIEITKELIVFMKKMKKKPLVFISGSAIGVYGTSIDKVFDETTPFSLEAQGAFPQEICQKWEAVAIEAQALGIRTCLLRTGLVLETQGGALAQMLFPFEFGLGGKMGSGQQWLSWIHRTDIVRLIIHILNEEGVSGAVNATAPEPVINTYFAKALAKAMKRPSFIPLSAFQVKLLFGAMGETLLLAGQKVLPQKANITGFTFAFPKIEEALKEIFKR